MPPVKETTQEEPTAPDSTAAATEQSQVNQELLDRHQAMVLREVEARIESIPISRAGLIRMLTSPAGFGRSSADAEVIANAIDLDWNEQAVLTAKNRLESKEMTRDELITHLTAHFGAAFTVEEANLRSRPTGALTRRQHCYRPDAPG